MWLAAATTLAAAAMPAQAPASCPAVTVTPNSVSVAAEQYPPLPLSSGSAVGIGVEGMTCSEAYYVLQGPLLGPDAAEGPAARSFARLGAQLRIADVRDGGLNGQDVVTVEARAAGRRLTYTALAPLRVDRTILRAGQHLNFVRGRRAGACTAAFVVRRGAVPHVLTAGHCAQRNETAVRVRGRNEPPRTVLGPVTRDTDAGDGPDALTIALTPTVLAHQAIERGDGWPLTVRGTVRNREQRDGLRVCFAGRTSGLRCGKVTKARFKSGARRLVCTNLKFRGGDSGGPVFTVPADGEVRAAGLVVGERGRFIVVGGEGCYAPIETVLDALDAALPPGPRPFP